MAAARNGTKKTRLDRLVAEASQRNLRALAAPAHKAKRAWTRAAELEELVSCWLEVEGHELDAAIHRFSAASCFAKAERYADAIILARSALSFTLKSSQRLEVEGYLKKWQAKARNQLRRQTHEQPANSF